MLKTAFGEMTSPNITPDPGTGIGGWSRDAFARAVREGIAPDGSNLYPTMSFTSYAKMSDADIDALYAYIMSLSPVRAEFEPAALDFPWNQRILLNGWRKLFFDNAEFEPDPGRSDAVNRGAYLVEGPAHCGECHSPRNALGGFEPGKALTGAAIEGYWAPNLTPDPSTGLGSWSEEDLYAYLSGRDTPHGGAFGPMHDVVAEGTSHLDDPDLRAMAAYLHQLAPQRNPDGRALEHAEATASVAIATVHRFCRGGAFRCRRGRAATAARILRQGGVRCRPRPELSRRLRGSWPCPRSARSGRTARGWRSASAAGSGSAPSGRS